MLALFDVTDRTMNHCKKVSYLLWLLPLCLALVLVESFMQSNTYGNEALDYDISVGVSGNAGPFDDFNPITVVYQKWPQYSTRVLGFINYRHPRGFQEIQSAIGMPESEARELLSSLEKCGLISWNIESGYRVSFAVFDDDVWQCFKNRMQDIAKQIDQEVMQHILFSLREQYDSSSFRTLDIPFEVIGLVVIGSFGLDNYAIKKLQQNGLVTVTKRQPGDRTYVVLSQAKRRATRFPLYGIHSDTWDGVYYATFGENAAMNKRQDDVQTLPDVVWNWRSKGVKRREEIDDFVLSLSKVVRIFRNQWFLLSDLQELLKSDHTEQLLQDWMRYGLVEIRGTDQYRIAFPIFAGRDLEHFQEIGENVGDRVLRVVQDFYPSLEEIYHKTLPSSHSVPIQEVLNLVYHHTYSLALDSIFLQSSDLRFSEEHGDLRYTGYAILK